MLCTLLLVLGTNPTLAQMACAKPSEQFTTETSGDINATAQGLTQIFSASVAADARKKVVDLIGKYPNADKVLLQRDLISATCELIKNSTTVDFDKKARLLIEITKEIQSAFAKASILLKPLKETMLVLSLYPPELSYYVAMTSYSVVFQRCELEGSSVEYGDGIEFQSYYAYEPNELKVVRMDAELERI